MSRPPQHPDIGSTRYSNTCAATRGRKQLEGSYINNLQIHDSSNISMCSSDSDAEENLNSHFNDRLSDQIYNTFRELFSNVNIDSVLERYCLKVMIIIGK